VVNTPPEGEPFYFLLCLMKIFFNAKSLLGDLGVDENEKLTVQE
jgi:hypothetical protein